MGLTLKREEINFADQMRSTVNSLDEIAGYRLHSLGFEEFLNPACDQLRYRFWLVDDRDSSATYTFKLTSNLTVNENAAELEGFVREQAPLATLPPE